LNMKFSVSCEWSISVFCVSTWITHFLKIIVLWYSPQKQKCKLNLPLLTLSLNLRLEVKLWKGNQKYILWAHRYEFNQFNFSDTTKFEALKTVNEPKILSEKKKETDCWFFLNSECTKVKLLRWSPNTRTIFVFILTSEWS
jgi:hypothetical protein